jgi:YD repeat-containing protein
MKYRNMRSQIAQSSAKDNGNNGYTSTITTWKSVNHSGKTKYLPDKEFRWRNSATSAAIPSFNWGTPTEGNGWILTQTFDQYDQHGNLTQVKDANGIATTISWDGTGTLIDSIKTRPNSTLKPLTTKYTYDPNTFRLTAITDPNNQRTEYKYDPLQRLIEMITPDKRTAANHIYYYSRDGNGGNFVNTDPNYVQTMTSTHAEHVRNHDFENGSGVTPDFWAVTNYGSGVGTWDNTTSFGGVKSLKAYIPSAGADNRVLWKATFDEPVSAKKYYRMEIWIKKAAGTAGDSIGIDLKFHNSAHTQTEVKKRTIALSSVTTGWLKFILEFTPLASTDHLYEASLDFRANNAGTVWFDRFNFYELGVTRIHADGLGRDIQTRQRWGNGSIKAATVYDFAGRVVKVTKPYQSANLSFTLAAIDSANAWYSQTAGNHPAYQWGQSSSEKEYDTSPYAFSETEYYPDPLNRVRYQYFPGTAFSKLGPDKK